MPYTAKAIKESLKDLNEVLLKTKIEKYKKDIEKNEIMIKEKNKKLIESKKVILFLNELKKILLSANLDQPKEKYNMVVEDTLKSIDLFIKNNFKTEEKIKKK